MTPLDWSPLPSHYLTDQPGTGGRLKVRPDDFLVQEIPSYEPDGSGEHLYLGIQKTGVAHGELLTVLQRHFGVTTREIGYAGMKDKQAVTQQVVSIHLRDDPRDVQLPHERIQVLWASRHRNKLRRGHLVGNRFSIRVRDVDPVHAPRALAVLRRLESVGMPGWYGEQRFGYRANNHRLGAMLLRREFDGVLKDLLGTGGSAFPEYQRERREAFDRGDFAAAAEAWTRADRSELIACRALERGETPERAIRQIGHVTLHFWTSALASALFNRCLDRRMADGTASTFLAGDLAWKHDSRAVFPVGPLDVDDPVLANRYDAFEISPTGPLFGQKMTEPSGAVQAFEQSLLDEAGLEARLMSNGPWAPNGRRRPFRDTVEHPEVDSGFDDHGAYIRCAFDLRRGMYATMVMREIMKNDGAADAADDARPEDVAAASEPDEAYAADDA